ncbi:MAG: hypothetical protein ABI789_02950, partial [Usitatibacter sp.]
MISFRTLIERLSPAPFGIRQALTAGVGVMVLGVVALLVVLFASQQQLHAARARYDAQLRISEAVARGERALL